MICRLKARAHGLDADLTALFVMHHVSSLVAPHCRPPSAVPPATHRLCIG